MSAPADDAPPDDALQITMRLLNRVNAGEKEALDALFARFYRRVRNIVSFELGYSRSQFAQHEDIVQETLLRAFQNFERVELRSIGQVHQWLVRCVRTSVVDAWRSRTAEKRGGGKERCFADLGDDSLSSSIFAGKEPSPSAHAMGRELEEQIERALLAMDERDRTVILYDRFYEFSDDEIKQALRLKTTGHVGKIRERARKKLQEMITPRKGSK